MAAGTAQVGDIALWAVPAGLVGARLYHVATDHDLYFGHGGRPIGALEIWHGGLGIWGAIAGGLLGAWFYCRRHGIRVRVLADALAPGLLLAQAIGRFGNYFNQELYGRPTKLPWGLEIDPSHWPPGRTFPHGTVFHPTFLYEAIWNLLGLALLVWLDRRFKLGFGRTFALYVMIYTAGGAGSRPCASTRSSSTTCSACAGGCGCRSSCSSARWSTSWSPAAGTGPRTPGRARRTSTHRSLPRRGTGSRRARSLL